MTTPTYHYAQFAIDPTHLPIELRMRPDQIKVVIESDKPEKVLATLRALNELVEATLEDYEEYVEGLP